MKEKLLHTNKVYKYPKCMLKISIELQKFLHKYYFDWFRYQYGSGVLILQTTFDVETLSELAKAFLKSKNIKILQEVNSEK